jgi:hypothetical protein
MAKFLKKLENNMILEAEEAKMEGLVKMRSIHPN